MNDKDKIKKIGKWLYDTGVRGTSNQNYIIDSTDIIEQFNVTQEWINQNAEDIDCALWEVEDMLDSYIEYDKNGNIECFNMMFTGDACCKVCVAEDHTYCCNCEVCHPEEWDKEPEYGLTLKDINLTRETKKAIKNYNLKNIHIGSLSEVPNCRYVDKRKIFCYDMNKLYEDLEKNNFIIVFNHWEQSHSCWTVWETPYMDFKSIKKIVDNEFHRKLWDSRQCYYDDGEKLIQILNFEFSIENRKDENNERN